MRDVERDDAAAGAREANGEPAHACAKIQDRLRGPRPQMRKEIAEAERIVRRRPQRHERLRKEELRLSRSRKYLSAASMIATRIASRSSESIIAAIIDEDTTARADNRRRGPYAARFAVEDPSHSAIHTRSVSVEKPNP